jgi:hypothetical protein
MPVLAVASVAFAAGESRIATSEALEQSPIVVLPLQAASEKTCNWDGQEWAKGTKNAKTTFNMNAEAMGNGSRTPVAAKTLAPRS